MAILNLHHNQARFDACYHQMSWPQPSDANQCRVGGFWKTKKVESTVNVAEDLNKDATIVPHKYSQNHLRISSN